MHGSRAREEGSCYRNVERGEAACPAPLGRLPYPGSQHSQHIPGPLPLPQTLWAGLFRARAGRVRGRMILLARPVNQSLVQKEVFQQESEAV